MFKYNPISTNQVKAINQNKVLKAQNEKLKADLDYIAMMTDIELETETEEDVYEQ